MMNYKRITIKVNEDLHKSLKLISVQENTTLQSMIIKAIHDSYSHKIDDEE